MKKKLITVLLIVMLAVGLGLLLYPTVADYWNSMHASRAIANYTEAVANIDDERYREMWEEAEAYNRELAGTGVNWSPDEAFMERYYSLLDVSGSGIMCYVEIPDIDVKLPVYHGTQESVLQIGAGHIAGSSLPVGGVGTHSIISGHTGLSSARLFTDLDKLHEGDIFLLNTLDETLTYQIDQIRIVLPYELGDLALDKDQDYVTLVTCTPYRINTHRLLVRGHRIETEKEPLAVRVTGDALLYDPLIVAPIVAVPMLIILLLWLLTSSRKPKKKKEEGTNQ